MCVSVCALIRTVLSDSICELYLVSLLYSIHAGQLSGGGTRLVVCDKIFFPTRESCDRSVTVIIQAFQAWDPGSTPGGRKYFDALRREESGQSIDRRT